MTAPEETGNKQSDLAALDRLRDRTDELELIISSLTIFALFSIPGWLFNKLADSFTHLSTSTVIAGNLGTTFLTGTCYGLGACFVIHLMVRAYWVGLIGLRSAFPDGIQWQKTKSMGPFTREHYRRSVPDMNTVIERADRLASSLFAVISLLTLGLLWLGSIMLITLVAAGVIGGQFGQINAAITLTSLALLVLFAGIPLLIYILDAQLASRFRPLRDSRFFVGVITVLRRISSLAYPKRLILPVQLTLQSNLPPFVFSVSMTVAIVAIVLLGNFRSAAWRTFTLSGEFEYLTENDARGGFRSTHYEDMPGSLDRLRAWPRITSFTQSGTYLQLFLPYQPLRDNIFLEQLCGERQDNYDAATCLQKLWAVSIEGEEVPMEGFIAAQRSDISMRGLMGAVSLEGLEPGIHRIEIVWNPATTADVSEIDDRFQFGSSTITIPFLFAPAYEISLN